MGKFVKFHIFCHFQFRFVSHKNDGVRIFCVKFIAIFIEKKKTFFVVNVLRSDQYGIYAVYEALRKLLKCLFGQ